jgi:hypothetical protein
MSGTLAPGDMTFDDRRPIAGPRRRRGEFEASYAVVEVHAARVRFLLNDVHVDFTGCSFTECVFEQRRSWFAAGAFGDARGRSVYRDCRFVGVDFGLRGFSFGLTRFENCTFDNCRTDHLYAVHAEFVGCRFLGRLEDATFVGTDPGIGIPYEIRDNDFRSAQLGRVALQSGVRFEDQHWPEGAVAQGDDSDWEIVVTQ